MQTYKYISLFVLILSSTVTLMKPTNLSEKDIHEITKSLNESIEKFESNTNSRFTNLEQQMKILTKKQNTIAWKMPRRLAFSPVKQAFFVSLVLAWGYWFKQTHPGECEHIKTVALRIYDFFITMPERQEQSIQEKEEATKRLNQICEKLDPYRTLEQPNEKKDLDNKQDYSRSK